MVCPRLSFFFSFLCLIRPLIRSAKPKVPVAIPSARQLTMESLDLLVHLVASTPRFPVTTATNPKVVTVDLRPVGPLEAREEDLGKTTMMEKMAVMDLAPTLAMVERAVLMTKVLFLFFFSSHFMILTIQLLQAPITSLLKRTGEKMVDQDQTESTALEPLSFSMPQDSTGALIRVPRKATTAVVVVVVEAVEAANILLSVARMAVEEVAVEAEAVVENLPLQDPLVVPPSPSSFGPLM